MSGDDALADGVHIQCCGNGFLWFRPYGDSLFLQTPKKSKQKNACSCVRPARWGSGSLRCGIDPGAAPTVCFAAPPLAVFGFAKRSLRSHPPDQSLHSAFRRRPVDQDQERQPSLRSSWSGAASPHGVFTTQKCGSWLASDGGLTAGQSLSDAVFTCRSCRRLRSFDLAFDCKKSKSKDRSLRQLLQGRCFVFNGVWNSKNFPTRFSGCPSDARSLVFACRCQFSDRV
jgi:hypothetical protein